MKTRFIIMLTVLVLASAGWTFGWRYLSSEAGHAFSKAIDEANQGEQQIACDNQRTSGFPFRLALRCDNPVYVKGTDLEVKLAGLHAQSFVYRPTHQVVDFKSPAQIKAGQFGTLELTWKKARLGSQLQTSGLIAATAKIEQARLRLLNPPLELENTVIAAEKLLVSARQSAGEEPDNSIVFGIVSNGLAVLGSHYTLPSIAMEASVLAYDIAKVFEGGVSPFPLWIENGGEADVQGISLVSGSAMLFMRGWVKLDQNGFVNADLDVDSTNLMTFVDGMGPELVQFQAISRAIVSAMEGLGEKVTLNGKSAKRVKVSIRKGFVKVGIIPLGAIPQIDLSDLQTRS